MTLQVSKRPDASARLAALITARLSDIGSSRRRRGHGGSRRIEATLERLKSEVQLFLFAIIFFFIHVPLFKKQSRSDYKNHKTKRKAENTETRQERDESKN